MKRILVFAVSLGLCILLNAQDKAREYANRIKSLQQSIIKEFYVPDRGLYREFDRRDTGDKKEFSYLWPLCGLIQATNETEKLKMAIIPMKDVMRTIKAYDDNRPPVPAYAAYVTSIERDDRFYDDNQWIAIASLDAYERTSDPLWLQEGKNLYRFMMSGYDSISGGGLYWKEGDPSTKNTCSNGPGVLVALQLYNATHQKEYLDTALLLFEWTNRWLLSPDSVYFDHVRLPSRDVDTRIYTYNTGTMLQSNVMLYEITRDQKYLKQAKNLADGAYKKFYRNGRLPGNSWFNAVLLRGYMALYKHDKERKYLEAFIHDADERWKNDRDGNGLLGKRKKKELIEQAASLEIYARLLQHLRTR